MTLLFLFMQKTAYDVRISDWSSDVRSSYLNATGDVLAYVGGVGLKSTAAAVDGANARRQAGSTLKPHLYAQVVEHGWLTAASILDDSPVQRSEESRVGNEYGRTCRSRG